MPRGGFRAGAGRPLGSRNRAMLVAWEAYQSGVAERLVREYRIRSDPDCFESRAVAMMAACGVMEPAIAKLLGLTIADMDERFGKQLGLGAILLKLNLLSVLDRKAIGGNIAAIKLLLARLDAARE
jgi:hypothetical protein